MRPLLTGLAAAALFGAAIAPAAAEPNCTCRASNVEVMLGETVCLSTPRGPRLAQCVMVLNNPSWNFLDGPCPQARLAQPPDERSTRASRARYPVIR